MTQPESHLPAEISVEEVKRLLEEGAEFVLLDCRRPDEHTIASIASARLIPMQELPQRLDELSNNRHDRIVVHCHHGGRSLRVTSWLRDQGFLGAQNMAGGIDAWSERIDPSVPRY